VEAVAERTQRRYALAAAARVRAQLVDPDVAEASFAESIEQATALGSPFELARSYLARSRHRAFHGCAGADSDSSRAIALFESLGASAWLAQAASSPPQASSLAVDQLTASELRVAMAVARGLTNRQAAIELYLSTKTVDFYLQSIYRKLGVRSRTEMTHRLLGEQHA
jgi:DNA-binding NarL/FixJ family response regulator